MVRTKKRYGGTTEQEDKFFKELDKDIRTKLEPMWNDPLSNRERIMQDFGNSQIKSLILRFPRFPWGIEQSDKARAPNFFPRVHDEDTITNLMRKLQVVGESDTPSGAHQSSGGTRRRRIHRRTHHRRRRTHRRGSRCTSPAASIRP